MVLVSRNKVASFFSSFLLVAILVISTDAFSAQANDLEQMLKDLDEKAQKASTQKEKEQILKTKAFFSILAADMKAHPNPSQEREDVIARIKAQFGKYHNTLEDLRKAAEEDKGDRSRFSVGEDHLGENYWKDSADTWHHSNDYKTKLRIDQVLSKIGLSKETYQQYMAMMKSLGAERITTSKVGSKNSTSLIFYRGGLSVSGCSVTVTKADERPKPFGIKGKGDFMDVIELGDKWFIEHECT